MTDINLEDFGSEREAMLEWLTQSFDEIFRNEPRAFMVLAICEDGVTVCNYKVTPEAMCTMIAVMSQSLQHRLCAEEDE